jgi:hypothetical protein
MERNRDALGSQQSTTPCQELGRHILRILLIGIGFEINEVKTVYPSSVIGSDLFRMGYITLVSRSCYDFVGEKLGRKITHYVWIRGRI